MLQLHCMLCCRLTNLPLFYDLNTISPIYVTLLNLNEKETTDKVTLPPPPVGHVEWIFHKVAPLSLNQTFKF